MPLVRQGVVCLSGGMDSYIAFSVIRWHRPAEWSALIFNYGQRSAGQEIAAASNLWVLGAGMPIERLHVLRLPLTGESSILAGSKNEVAEYASPEAAKAGTSSDLAYIPLRNALLLTHAAAWLLARSPHGGLIVTGIRARSDGSGGFPDCTAPFASAMGDALTEASGVRIEVLDPLNYQYNKPGLSGRANSIILAEIAGVAAHLKYSVSCYHGNRCGKCLPCVRRAQAYAELGKEDPAHAP